MVGLETPRSRLASPTVAAPLLSRSTISRRIGWASAAKASLAIMLTIFPHTTEDGGGDPMPEHAVGTQERWLSARKELLAAEKEHMRQGDELARRRRELPWVPVEKEYTFETDEGSKTLADLFDGRSQLLPLHVRLRIPRRRAEPRLHRLLVRRRPLRRRHPPPQRTRRDPGQRVDRTATGAAAVQGADGLEVPLGLIARQRLQVRLRGGVHRGAAAQRSRLQLHARRPGGAAARRDERVRPPGRSGPPHLLDLRSRRRAADGDLRIPGRGAVGPQRGPPKPGRLVAPSRRV